MTWSGSMKPNQGRRQQLSKRQRSNSTTKLRDTPSPKSSDDDSGGERSRRITVITFRQCITVTEDAVTAIPLPETVIAGDRCSPIQTGQLLTRVVVSSLRFSPPPRLADTCLSRSPSPDEVAYAGAKFSDPPSPELLPKPPSHWMSFDSVEAPHSCTDMSSQLKMILKVATQT